MGRISEFFGNPGVRPDLHHRAPIHGASSTIKCEDPSDLLREEDEEEKDLKEQLYQVNSLSDVSTTAELTMVNLEADGTVFTDRGFTGLDRGWTDKILDKFVSWAGTQFVFLIMWAILIIWIIVGAVYGGPDVWQVVMQDGQSIQSYIWDTLLMRQQLNSSHDQVLVCCQLRSRISTFKRFMGRRIAQLKSHESGNNEIDETKQFDHTNVINKIDLDTNVIKGNLPVENWYDKLSSTASNLTGSVPTMVIFWLGVIVWIICGVIPKNAGNSPPYTGRTSGSNPELARFSDTWQMYINTAVAVSLLICTSFLQNIRARHDKYISKFLLATFEIDEKIETKLREHFHDFETSNPVVTIYSNKRSWGEKIIDWYADIIGTGVGVVIAIAAFVVWLCIGSTLHWDDNWWLIIGTYTGLVGFLDGFVIRQVYFRIIAHEEYNYKLVAEKDMELFEILGLTCPEEFNGEPAKPLKLSLSYKLSSWVNHLCSTQWSVLASIIIILGLIIAASALLWSTTAQLFVNSPTMIIEEFFLIVLLQAHNWADQQRRVEVSALLVRRHILLSYVNELFD
ncbi:hypothetical protein KAFR_0C05290 [Kazachstania africana CBS 2517]|uniref:Low-affinity Fe(2+) transport protein n=1 Tax=Kazachstania africana (strain ATCC 22294 / BCRC 22015 / CBS 2517 / CECT 1963 / NBRC 1671 / NRRL Y-8276) TaxID=1071382 RepID=H2AT20_KAZAF|nr:hypothetical protein KAFR_0C05290 [Kazachstania africana CBS 2517]CCF57520.1 hypothetical protein KAFR_0C05290 [Kazachstania africana CBS 2517]